MKFKSLLIASALFSSLSALATVPESILDCRSNIFQEYGTISVAKLSYSDELILFTGNDEIWMKREKYQDGTCPAPSIRYVGTAKDGKQVVFYGEMERDFVPAEGKSTKITFSIEQDDKQVGTKTYRCIKGDSFILN